MNRERAEQFTYLLLRLVAGFMFFQFGTMKLFGWWGGMPPGVTLTTQIWIGAILELVGSIAIMLGFLTGPVAFILSGEMAVAYWQFHFPGGTWPLQNQGVPAVLYCFLYLYMAARGGGDLSLDAMLWGKQRRGSS